MRQVNASVDALIAAVSFGELIRQLAAAEMEMVLADPLFDLHAILEVTLPNHSRVQEFLRAQDQILLPAWAAVYERIAAAYQLELDPRYTWIDVAVLCNSLINGILTSARAAGGHVATLTNGDNILTGGIFTMLPALFGVEPAAAETLYARTAGQDTA
jgi:hypothetical protein